MVLCTDKKKFLNKANTTDTEAPSLDLHLSIANGFVSSNIYDKRDDFFDIMNYPVLQTSTRERQTSPAINFEKYFLNFVADTELISKFNVGLKTLLPEGLAEPEFYGD